MTAARDRSGPGLWAVIPVKPFDRAKSRLSAILSPAERAALTEAMFRDVLAAAGASGLFARVLVATSCPEAAALARTAGAAVLADSRPDAGTGEAVAAALAALPPGAAAMVIQADLPLLRAADLIAVATAHRAGPGVTLVPARDGGTAILALSAPWPIPPAFGPDSLARHRALARTAGLDPAVAMPAGAVRDLDRPGDLELLRDCLPGSHCAALSRLARRAGGRGPKPKQEREARHDESDRAGYAPVR